MELRISAVGILHARAEVRAIFVGFEPIFLVTGLDILDGRVRFSPGDFAAVFPL